MPPYFRGDSERGYRVMSQREYAPEYGLNYLASAVASVSIAVCTATYAACYRQVLVMADHQPRGTRSMQRKSSRLIGSFAHKSITIALLLLLAPIGSVLAIDETSEGQPILALEKTIPLPDYPDKMAWSPDNRYLALKGFNDG